MAVGADLWHMNSMIGRAIAHFELDGMSYNYLCMIFPGGYVFTHLVFWTVIALVALGTNAVAIMLSVGLGLLVLEAVKAR